MIRVLSQGLKLRGYEYGFGSGSEFESEFEAEAESDHTSERMYHFCNPAFSLLLSIPTTCKRHVHDRSVCVCVIESEEASARIIKNDEVCVLAIEMNGCNGVCLREKASAVIEREEAGATK